MIINGARIQKLAPFNTISGKVGLTGNKYGVGSTFTPFT